MKYIKYKPAAPLEKYIDFYWVLETGAAFKPVKAPTFADPCTDIFVNFGNSAATYNNHAVLSPGVIYMGGITVASGFIYTLPDSTFIGIRFKPGGLPVFYNLPQFEIVEQMVEFSDKTLYSILDMDAQMPARLDHFFMAKLQNATSFLPIGQIVSHFKGQITVDMLAEKCNVSNRTLERLSYANLGTNPKEFISIIRFQQALKTLKKGQTKGKLLEVALEAGYYDHAHLTRDFKKYAGVSPSAIYLGPSFP